MISIRPANINDVPLILTFIKELAEYEKSAHKVSATEEILRETLFGEKPYAEVIIASLDNQPVGHAIFCPKFSTYLGRPGMYLDDIYVRPRARGYGVGKKLLAYLAQLTIERNYGRLDWVVLDWNTNSIEFYKKIGAKSIEDSTIFRVTGKELEKLAFI